MRKCIFLMLLIMLSGNAVAGMVIQADTVNLQAQIDRDDIGFRACGVRAVVSVILQDTVELYDFSLNVDENMSAGLLKAGKSRTSLQSVVNNKPKFKVVEPSPIKFWIAKSGEGSGANPLKILPAEDAGFILELANLKNTYQEILAIISSERMQFAVGYKNERIERIVEFSTEMSESDKTPLLNCMHDVAERMLKNANKEQAN